MNINRKKFIPFHHLDYQKAIVVDGKYPHGLVLSHWKGANIHSTIEADTSAAIVINALKSGFPGLEIPLVSATHFDIDGFIGVWCLFNQKLALEHELLLKEIAYIGDFREINQEFPQWRKALKLVCWLNQVEKNEFYPPYGEKDEIELCPQKFDFFLENFERVLHSPDKFKAVWGPEYEEVIQGLQVIHNPKKTLIEIKKEISISTVQTDQPLHYYPLFSPGKGMDIQLSIYSEQRYELEYKYHTWVDIVSRPVYPRLNLDALILKLNKMEKNEGSWSFGKITDTGPILRLSKQVLEKQSSYNHPNDRVIERSSIPPDSFVHLIYSWFLRHYSEITPKKQWTWKEFSEFN